VPIAPFALDSRNFNDIPDETKWWFNELLLLLNLCCEVVLKKEPGVIKHCFEKLFDLIARMDACEEIIFAHEFGDWMVICRHDYQTIYQQL